MPTRARRLGPKTDAEQESRFDRRLGEILYFATNVFYDKGYEGASMRDLSRASGMSLAGLYYYFESKEKLLYLIQKHSFSTIMQMLRDQLERESDPELRVRIFIRNHLAYFLANLKAMKVLSHEDEALAGPLGQEIKDMKREYYLLCRGLVEDLKRDRGVPTDRVSARVAVLSLFGMMNWIYTWHDPRRDLQAADLAEQMSEIFLSGLLGAQELPAKAARTGLTGSATRAGVTRGGAPSMGNSQKSPARR
jgi:AcrR family transcriptional regulator